MSINLGPVLTNLNNDKNTKEPFHYVLCPKCNKEIKLGKVKQAFIGKVRLQYRWRAIKRALQILWRALCGWELTYEWRNWNDE